MTRIAVLGAALVFIAVFAFLTFTVVLERGLEVLTVLSILVLVLLAIGIVGALRNPPQE